MEYRDFGKTGLRVSRFGLGCMRFPPDEAEAVRIVRRAVDRGVNYLDTGYVYRNSEEILGRALGGGYRERVALATKSPLREITGAGDFEKYLDEQLRRLGTDHIDVYLLHNICPEYWERVKKFDAFSFLDRMVAKGKILRRGFSIHNTTEAFKEIVDAYDWEMAQIQFNILGETQQVGLEGLRYGAEKGLAMVIMEPLRGGQLLSNAPEEAGRLIDAYPDRRSLAEWCFRWLYNMEEVTLVLSGVSTLDQLEDNLRIFENSKPGVMSEKERGLIRRIQEIYESQKSIGCTACRYCMPCPRGVDIPGVFRVYNEYLRLGRHANDKLFYRRNIFFGGSGGDRCVSCGRCARRCPQALEIPALLQSIHGEFME
jgi:predicted aldo/keto reductase-like oxidoreductase